MFFSKLSSHPRETCTGRIDTTGTMGAAISACVASLSPQKQALDDDDAQSDDEQMNPQNPTATFKVGGGISGEFTAEVFLDRTPLTASNFIDLAQSGFYNGLHFHRVSGPPPSPLLSLLQR